ncbi:alpha/beta hydrolase [Sedimenticola selenatireducens]|uniref:Alpha/beta hydrolase n=1 Tax=Sedimenticola selenatireducens TaxID=191960 RepID=A0A2N6D1A7_9GAMM|nr:alpha/beta hydrolase [Sedimenticola selenatireducens]PLX63463.1 MAG: alpha/beta hydrolase [Sedimenticola selenatireducens]
MLNVILIAAGIYAVLLLIVYLNQSSLLYLPGMPSRELTASPRDIGLIHEDVRLLTDDGVDLHGWYIPTERARGTLLFFHGNAGIISHRLESLQIFHQLGLNVLIFDYRGYGQSQGQPGERGTQLDALAAWHHLVDIRGESPDRIVLFGRSLGGALAAWLAARVQPGALILESAFISVPELAAELYWWLPARLLSRLQYNTRNYLAEVHCPVQVIHSREDEIIPYRHGQSLYEAAHPPRTFLELRGDHNTGFIVSGDNYMRGLETFLTAHLPDPLKEHRP